MLSIFEHGRHSIFEISFISSLINAIPIKIEQVILGYQQPDCEVYMEYEKTHNSQHNIEKESEEFRHCPNSKLIIKLE